MESIGRRVNGRLRYYLDVSTLLYLALQELVTGRAKGFPLVLEITLRQIYVGEQEDPSRFPGRNTSHVKKSSPEIPGLVATTQESVEEAEKLIQGLQNHWLLRGSMEQTREGSPVEISQRETPYGLKGGDSR